jgi:hypothetical protein
MAALDAKKRFLDYAGLAQFWGIIDTKFATKAEAAEWGSFKFQNKNDDALNTVQMQYNNCLPEGSGKEAKVIELPKASRTAAGTMSADHFSIIEDLQANIESMAPFAGLDIEGDEVSLNARRANIGLKYVVDGSVAEDNRTAKIQLLDLSYPTDGEWLTSTAEEYEANHEANPGKYIVYKTYTGSGTNMVTNYAYYKWTGETAGPVNSTGKPITTHAVSEIDVTELIRTGLLESTDVVIEGGKTKIKLGFIVHNNGVDSVEYQYIDVTDLVDIYTQGEGITITDAENVADDTARTGVIKLNLATDTTKGGIKTGYVNDKASRTYGVDVDENEKAFVNVPWKDVYVTGKSEGENGKQQKYLTVTINKTEVETGNDSPNVNFEVQVEAGDGLQQAEALSKTSIQSVAVGEIDDTKTGADLGGVLTKDAYIQTLTVDTGWGKNVTVELTDSAEASLALADSALQKVNVESAAVADRPLHPNSTGADLEISDKITGKGNGEQTISLGQKTIDSLNLADTSIQKIVMFAGGDNAGTELEVTLTAGEESNTVNYTRATAEVDLGLGSAAHVNITEDVTLATQTSDVDDKSVAGDKESRKTVATTGAVKTYVDTRFENYDNDLKSYIDTTVDGLDSDISASTDGKVTAEANLAHTYGPATMVWDKIVIRDGKLIGPNDTNPDDNDTEVSTLRTLSISDIVDFRPLSTAEINTICGIVG